MTPASFFEITAYKTLCETYPTWPELKHFLLSKQGGFLRCIEEKDTPFAILRYVKGTSDFTKEHVQYFRSVVWNTEKNRPVCVAPIKAQKGPPPKDVTVRISDFIDGVMMQAYRTNGAYSLATRTSIGARGTFYSDRTFADLLGDALRPLGGMQTFLDSVLEDDTFASFVLQHPEHKTVAVISKPKIYVTYIGRVKSDGVVEMHFSPNQWKEPLQTLSPPVFEMSHTLKTNTEGEERLEKEKFCYSWQGLVFQEVGTQRRWRLRNPDYVVVRTLRGPEANASERFLRLRSQGQMKEYLHYFREDSPQMWAFEQRFRQRTQGLYDAYTHMYKFKKLTMKDLPLALRPHVYALHGEYLKSLPPKESAASAAASATAPATDAPTAATAATKIQPIVKGYVIQYVNTLSIEEQKKLLESPIVEFVHSTNQA